MTFFSKKIEGKLKEAVQPLRISPMLATLVHTYFSDPNWIFECKLDGQRCLLHKKNKSIKIFSRNGAMQNAYYPEITSELQKLPGNFILDCEIVTFEKNLTSFSKLQSRLHVRSPSDKLIHNVPIHAYIFDIIYLEKYNLCELPLSERKNILKSNFKFNSPLHLLPYQPKDGEKYLNEACKKGWEGLIAKNVNSTYIEGRSRNWLKFKCKQGQEFIVGGFTKPKGKRIRIGALLLGYYQGKKLKYAGRVGTGFNNKILEHLYLNLNSIKQLYCPFVDFNVKNTNITWVQPKLVVAIGFTEWTAECILRHPRFLGLRYDKDPKEIVKE